MEIQIRKALQEDCPRLMELVRELAEFERAPQEVTVTLEHFIESGFGTHPVWWAIVAEVDGRVEGMALYYVRFSTWVGQQLYLEDLIVTEAMRGKGLGKLLFDELIEEARHKGFGSMIWQVLDWNESAIEFYRQRGARFNAQWVNCILSL